MRFFLFLFYGSLFVILILAVGSGIKAQSLRQPYNRFQYGKLKWKTFKTSSFHLYFTEGNDSLCAFVTKELPGAVELIKTRMVSSLDWQHTPSIIIYPSLIRQYESNIGGEQTIPVTLPTLVIKGNRMILHFTGSYADLKQQLYEALARALWEQQFTTGEQSAQQLTPKQDIPYWYKEGSIRYFGEGWTIAAEDQLKAAFYKNHYTNWYQVMAGGQELAGQAFCYYLSDRFIKNAPAYVLAQIRKKKTLPGALRLVTKKYMDSLYILCFDYYRERFNIQQDTGAVMATTAKEVSSTFKKAGKGKLVSLSVHPSLTMVAYTLEYQHQRTVYVYDTIGKLHHKITSLSLPPWLTSHEQEQFPMLQWSEDGQKLLIAQPEKGKIIITAYQSKGGKYPEHYQLNRVEGISSFQQTGRYEFLLSAWRNGQTDLVNFNEQKGRYYPLTDDIYSDGAAQPLPGNTTTIAFTSDRPQKIHNTEDSMKRMQGIYLLNGSAPFQPVPLVTDTIDYIHWNDPQWLDDNRLLVSGTATGTKKYYLLNPLRKSGKPNPVALSDFEPVQYHDRSKTIIRSSNTRDSILITTQKVNEWIAQHTAPTADTTSPWLTDYHKRAAERAKEDSILKAAKDPEPSFLEGVLISPNAKQEAQLRKDSIAASLRYDPKKIRPYILQLYSAYFSAKVNNDYLINRYQPYTGYQGQFKFPELGGMAQAGFSDLLENHHFSIAYRLPAATEGSSFFIKYRNTKDKIDWGLTWFRDVTTLQPDPDRNWVDENGRPYPNAAKVKTHYYELSFHDPLSYYAGLDFTTAIRRDRTIFLATDKYSLDFPALVQTWSINTLSYGIQKLTPTIPLLYKGFEAKVIADAFIGIAPAKDAAVGLTAQLSWHQPLYRYITWVSCLQGGISGGSNKILYNLGGVDNNITPRVDSTVHFTQDAPYVFQTLVTPFRGYYQNSLFGDRYAVWNNDVYFPLFQTLIPIETAMTAINNLQPGLFADVAMAKESHVTIPRTKNTLWSYGLSARTSLAGYPVRLDVAWPGSFSKNPVWYLSLNIK